MVFSKSYDNGRLDQLKKAVEGVRAALPEELRDTEPERGGGILSKAALFRNLLIQRICECADASLMLCEANRIIPAMMLIRIVAETTIMLCWLHQKSVEFITARDKEAFEGFLRNGTFGNSRSTALDQLCNVLMLVDRLDKEEQGFKQMFNEVCQYTDTNYAAAISTSGWVDTNRGTLQSDEKSFTLPDYPGGECLMACLKLAGTYYGRISVTLAATDAGDDRRHDHAAGRKDERHIGKGTRT